MPSLAPFDVNGTKEKRQMTKKITLQSLDETDFSTEKKKKKDSKNKVDDSESLGEDYKKEEMEIMMCAASLCLLHSSSRRPTMKTDLKQKPKYLLTIIVGLNQRQNIDRMVKKFSEDFQLLLFHYDGRTSEWDEFEWSKSAIHVSARRQTKWFLHPDVVAAYEYIFIWDEDLGVEHFNEEKFTEEKLACDDPHVPPCAAEEVSIAYWQ
ncbi:hypothetical protein Pint_11418 [Pistacia integerrima]|uniref:Uncharacterized protein n=1 Tax=Pistacia integerrima TaxID=434235 RepID=A0ACC0XG22_9ROSI|nr:hypothetical protein Pint_11418 [Pistacia integerrima]